MLTQMDGIRAGRCLDAHSTDIEPGGQARVFPCVKRWAQFFSFGNGTFAPNGSMHMNVPQHIVDRIRESRPDEPPQENHLCLGVLGRGENDEGHLYEYDSADEAEDSEAVEQQEEIVEEYDDDQFGDDGFLKLEHFKNKTIVATRCSNVGAVIDWLFVPYIIESEEGTEDVGANTAGEEADKNEGAAESSDELVQPPLPPTCSTDSCPESDHPQPPPAAEDQIDDNPNASIS